MKVLILSSALCALVWLIIGSCCYGAIYVPNERLNHNLRQTECLVLGQSTVDYNCTRRVCILVLKSEICHQEEYPCYVHYLDLSYNNNTKQTILLTTDDNNSCCDPNYQTGDTIVCYYDIADGHIFLSLQETRPALIVCIISLVFLILGVAVFFANLTWRK